MGFLWESRLHRSSLSIFFTTTRSHVKETWSPRLSPLPSLVARMGSPWHAKGNWITSTADLIVQIFHDQKFLEINEFIQKLRSRLTTSLLQRPERFWTPARRQRAIRIGGYDNKVATRRLSSAAYHKLLAQGSIRRNLQRRAPNCIPESPEIRRPSLTPANAISWATVAQFLGLWIFRCSLLC